MVIHPNRNAHHIHDSRYTSFAFVICQLCQRLLMRSFRKMGKALIHPLRFTSFITTIRTYALTSNPSRSASALTCSSCSFVKNTAMRSVYFFSFGDNSINPFLKVHAHCITFGCTCKAHCMYILSTSVTELNHQPNIDSPETPWFSRVPSHYPSTHFK